MFYRWKATSNSDSTYEFTVIFYRNCQGFTAGVPTTLTVEAISISKSWFGSFPLSMLPTSGNGIPPLEPPGMYNCTNNYNSICYEEYVYRGDWESPRRAADWRFSIEMCCRPMTLQAPANIGYDSQWIECGLNNLDFPDQQSKNWSALWHNRRPNHPGYGNDTVINYFLKTLCEGTYYTLDQGAREYQGDSLAYNFYWPQGFGGANAVYIHGASLKYPLPTLNGPLTINPVTGLIPLVPGAPAYTGIYILGIEVSEYRNDTIISGGKTVIMPKKIGYNRREITIYIQDSSDCRKDSVHIKDIYLDTIPQDNKIALRFHNGNSGEPDNQVKCNTLSPDGSEFRVVDSSKYVYPYDTTVRNIGILGADWTCYNGLTFEVRLELAEPLKCGEYSVILKLGTDLDVLQSECGFWEPVGSSAKIHTGQVKAVKLGDDKKVCRWSPVSVRLDAGRDYGNKPYASYFWNTWDSTREITATYLGKYWVEVKNNFECTSTDTLEIIEVDCPGEGSGKPVIHISYSGLDENDEQNFRIYPNPADDFVIIEIPDQLTDAEYFMVDVEGKCVSSGTLNSTVNRLNASQISRGYYRIFLNYNGLRISGGAIMLR